MTKDEEDLIEDWIVYHGTLFGYHNLYIIDNYSSKNVTECIYRRYQIVGLNVIYTKTDLNKRQDFITQCMLERAKECDFMIKLDTDEFLMYTLDGK